MRLDSRLDHAWMLAVPEVPGTDHNRTGIDRAEETTKSELSDNV